MRRAWLPLIWLVGTSTAVLVGWSAVQAVVGQVVMERPEPLSAQTVHELGASPTPSTGAAPATPTAAPTQEPSATQPASARTPAPGGSAGSSAPAAQSGSARTFTLQGGTASVSCSNNQISLNWATPNAGFQVQLEWHDSNTVLEVRFTGSSHESRLETWCSGNQVQASVEEQSS